MDDLLKPIKSTPVRKNIVELPVVSEKETVPGPAATDSPDNALKALQNQPNRETLRKVLELIAGSEENPNTFSIATPGPQSARLINVLVNATIPDQWRVLNHGSDGGREVGMLIRCLKNVSGLGAIISRLKLLVLESKQKSSAKNFFRDPVQHIEDLLAILCRLLEGNSTCLQIWKEIRLRVPNEMRQDILWKEAISLIGSGKMLSTAAQAEDALRDFVDHRKETWIAKGEEYASWLGENIAYMIGSIEDGSLDFATVTQLCSKSLMLGYTDRIVSSICAALLDSSLSPSLPPFIAKLAPHDQRRFFNSILGFLQSRNLGASVAVKEETQLQYSSMISAAAKFLCDILARNELLREHTTEILAASSSPVIDLPLRVRRSMMAALSQDEDSVQKVMEKSLELFGDILYIRHTPILQQEALAENLVLSCGYVHRTQPMFLSVMARSSIQLNAMSHRMAASSPRARFLGMAVGMTISELVDKPDMRLKFELEENENEEARWYKSLTHVQDKLGSIDDLKQQAKSSSKPGSRGGKARTSQPRQLHPSSSKVQEVLTTGPRIVEVEEESDDDDLIPYAKPDSDSEDDTDDPTLVQRNKPTAPVYIRDLIEGLHDAENYDRHELALSTAAPLIRRKTNFGTEVSDHIEELAGILVGLNDNFDLPNFAEKRQQALIAVLLAKPSQMAQWFAHSFFSGDYSLIQRVAMLTTIGLGARELAGLKDDVDSSLSVPTPSFPSKTLPSRLHKLYTAEATPVATLTSHMQKTMMEPMALSAADQLTGPNILKVRTFSSRMEVEKKRKKPVPNALAQIVAKDFFFPLTGRWWMHQQSTSNRQDNLYTSPHLLPPYLQTLAIVLNAAGPTTLQLPQMTSELWDLLLSVRGIAVHDKTILSALLFAFLTLLECNEGQSRLATEQGKELLETQEWVRGVFERLSGGGEEDERVRVLAAGVLIRCQEVVEKYQRLMVGDMVGY